MISKSKLEELVKAKNEEELKHQIRDEFIDRTNRQNLYAQIKKFVQSGKNCYQENLKERRTTLRILLESEKSEYEEEFIRKIKARVEEHVRERQESLMALKIEKAKENEEFVKKKKIQLYMNNCDEIRQQLRNRLLKETKTSQIAQIKEKRQKEIEEKAEECLWLQVRKRIKEEQDKKQKYEDCLRKIITKENRRALDKQILEHKEAKAIEIKESLEERLRNEERLKAELQDAASAKELEVKKKMKQAQELKIQLKEGILQKKMKQEKDAHFECLFNEEVNRQREQEYQILKMKESSMKVATLRYLEYLHNLKKEMIMQRKEQDKAFETYRMRDECETLKRNQEMKIRKQNEAKMAHQELLKQICENEERRLKQEQAEFESALVQRQIYQNELQKEKDAQIRKIQAALTYGKELFQQIEEIRAFEAMEKKRFEDDLRKALDEEDHCRILAKKFIEEDIDYLPAHPNWKLICCPCITDK